MKEFLEEVLDVVATGVLILIFIIFAFTIIVIFLFKILLPIMGYVLDVIPPII